MSCFHTNGHRIASGTLLCAQAIFYYRNSVTHVSMTLILITQKHPDATAAESTDLASPVKVTSDNLFQVLSEVHRLLVRRDPKEIFANPVTDDVAFGYSQVIANPMDLGTIYTRLCSRTFYQSATDYLADVTLMCDNAMVYNSPDTIYYQRARK
ncbi:unnamed protein product, partial [Dicrocoelium dendriticum]